MASITTKDIVSKSAADLSKLVAEKREALRAFRFGTMSAKSKDVKEGRNLRKDIARILTVMGAQKKTSSVEKAK